MSKGTDEEQKKGEHDVTLCIVCNNCLNLNDFFFFVFTWKNNVKQLVPQPHDNSRNSQSVQNQVPLSQQSKTTTKVT